MENLIVTYRCAQATGQISNLTAVDTTLASQIAAANQLTGLVNQTATAGLTALNSRVTLVCGQSYVSASALRWCSLCTLCVQEISSMQKPLLLSFARNTP